MVNTILTDHERREIHRKAALAPSAVDALIAETEAAVLAKLREQEPQGWKLVPVEPNYQMGRAWLKSGQTFEQAYAAMLAAAPQPPQAEQCHKRRNDACGCSRKAMLCDGMGPPQAEQAAEPVDSHNDIWNALQRISSTAVLLPTFEVRHEGGIDAFTQNIVDAIRLAATQAPQAPQAEQAAEPVPVWHKDLMRAKKMADKSDKLNRHVLYGRVVEKHFAALASTERQPEVPAQWQEAMKVAREALDGMLQVHGVTQNDAIRHDTIPTSWVELSDEARAALAQLDSLGIGGKEQG